MSGLREERCLGAVLAMKIARLFVRWEAEVSIAGQARSYHARRSGLAPR